MRFALVTGLCLLAAAPLLSAGAGHSQDRTQGPSTRDSYRARLNENTVTIMAGGEGTDLTIVQDIAAVLDNGDALRVVPMVGKGPAQTLKDVMFMRGVDMGITQANILKHYAKTGELGNIGSQIAYVAKLFNEEMHVLARDETTDIRALEGKAVNFGPEGSGSELTSRLVFEALGINVQPRHLDEADAIAQLKAGEIDASVVVTGKPAPTLVHLEEGSGLKLLGVPYAEGLEDEYYPAAFSEEDYPALIQSGQRVDSLAVCAVLVSFNWTEGDRYRKLDNFVSKFFSKFDAFQVAPRHPKWQEVNFAATLEGWRRSPLSQTWIDQAKRVTDNSAKQKFDTFLAQASPSGGAPQSDEERARLFRAFLEWSKKQSQN
ncbi:MAG: TAXI family TRAP transporter solute-binding subunit [Methyloceanibacter sp.]